MTGLNVATPSALSFCQGAKPIYWSPKDTPKTVEQVKELNAVYKSACMAAPKPAK